MKICKAKISHAVFEFLNENIFKYESVEDFNQWILNSYHFIDFCSSEEDFLSLKKDLEANLDLILKEDRAEYGDFQTPSTLVEKTCKMLQMKNTNPQVCIEPTCGKGNFLLGALKNWDRRLYIQKI